MIKEGGAQMKGLIELSNIYSRTMLIQWLVNMITDGNSFSFVKKIREQSSILEEFEYTSILFSIKGDNGEEHDFELGMGLNKATVERTSHRAIKVRDSVTVFFKKSELSSNKIMITSCYLIDALVASIPEYVIRKKLYDSVFPLLDGNILDSIILPEKIMGLVIDCDLNVIRANSLAKERLDFSESESNIVKMLHQVNNRIFNINDLLLEASKSNFLVFNNPDTGPLACTFSLNDASVKNKTVYILSLRDCTELYLKHRMLMFKNVLYDSINHIEKVVELMFILANELKFICTEQPFVLLNSAGQCVFASNIESERQDEFISSLLNNDDILHRDLIVGNNLYGSFFIVLNTGEYYNNVVTRYLTWLINIAKDAISYKNEIFELKVNSNTDYLTGAKNKRLLESSYNKGIEGYKSKDFGLGVVFIDVDDFKKINDKYGHIYGDEVLVQIVRSIRKCIRTSDDIFRYGGDEFVVLVENVFQTDLATILKKIEASISSTSKLAEVSVSIGACLATSLDPNLNEILKKVDKAMYSSKNNGKGRFVII